MSLIRPITCGKCKTKLGTFNLATGHLIDGRISDVFRVCVAVIRCHGCGANVRFDGVKAKRRAIRNGVFLEGEARQKQDIANGKELN